MNPSFAKNRGMLVPRVGWPRYVLAASVDDDGDTYYQLACYHNAGEATVYCCRKCKLGWSGRARWYGTRWGAINTTLNITERRCITPTEAAKFLRKWGHTEAAAASANATEALRKLLAVCNEVNNVHGLIKDNPMFRRLIEAFDALQAAKEAK